MGSSFHECLLMLNDYVILCSFQKKKKKVIRCKQAWVCTVSKAPHRTKYRRLKIPANYADNCGLHAGTREGTDTTNSMISCREYRLCRLHHSLFYLPTMVDGSVDATLSVTPLISHVKVSDSSITQAVNTGLCCLCNSAGSCLVNRTWCWWYLLGPRVAGSTGASFCQSDLATPLTVWCSEGLCPWHFCLYQGPQCLFQLFLMRRDFTWQHATNRLEKKYCTQCLLSECFRFCCSLPRVKIFKLCP